MRRRRWLWTLLLVSGVMTAVADPLTLRHSFRPAKTNGVVIVPGGHLRRWDPVTIFFPRNVSSGAGPEDQPGRYLDVFPDHPGAFTWIDARTLQFRPAEPWPPLARLRWSAGGEDVRLNTLMAPPIASLPADGSDGLQPVDEITLSFSDPLDPEALADMIAIDLRPLPGVGEGQVRTLDRDDFAVKTLARTSPDAPARYAVLLQEAIPLGTRARLRLRLSVDSDGTEGLTAATLQFDTAEPFRAVSMGCLSHRLPLTRAGVVYADEQPLDCGTDAARIVVEFSAPPAALGAMEARNLVRFSPAVENLQATLHGQRLEIRGDFQRDQAYRVRLVPTVGLTDVHGRGLENTGESSLSLSFPALPASVALVSGDGIVERFGPQRIPLQGRGADAVDVRIHRLDPLDLRMWPFQASQPIVLDESQPPPGPGEAPVFDADPLQPLGTNAIRQQIPLLGSPLVSAVVPLPLKDDGATASFGLDLSPYFAQIAGAEKPATYLVGVRDLGGQTRSWARVQVTDLSLTTVEIGAEARLVVTSLSSGQPVSGATVRIEGYQRDDDGERWTSFATGRTGRDGGFTWEAPGPTERAHQSVLRIVVEKGNDRLVINPQQPPQRYAASSGWASSGRAWLQWGVEDLSRRTESDKVMCHLFPERPVIRPEQPVHLKGYARREAAGSLSVVRGEARLTIRGPGLQREVPLSLTSAGSLYHRFEDDAGLPSGVYTAEMAIDNKVCARTDFTIDAYRIPRFEVMLGGEEQVPLDVAFPVTLDARYYAGGRLAERPVRWRVSQHPYTWTPKTDRYTGYLFSSDGRFSRTERFVSAPRLETVTETDAQGRATLMLDPTAELTAQPRTYAVEATVTGDGDETVTATRRVTALPPLIIGLKVPRFLSSARRITPEIVVLDPDGEPLGGAELTVRLLQRQWHAHLQAGDFTDGAARYVTETVDVFVDERQILSDERPRSLSLDIPEAGVYIVEVSGADAMGRAVRVRADLFASGGEPVSWQAPEAGVFTMVSDKDAYDPGDVASLVIESPFQQAEALVVVEAPDGPEYSWVPVRGGQAVARLRVGEAWVPQVPVHVVLMRGRLEGAGEAAGEDLGKPTTVAASTTLTVTPRRRRLAVDLEHPAQALPGATIPMTVRLKDHRGLPSAGEVTLWLVDAAVLALGREQPLDPVPSFLRFRRPSALVRDTRNLAFGMLPYHENPGGDGSESEEPMGDPFARATVRRNFSPVPYYNPTIQVPASGRITVPVALSDSLTTFRVRAKAAAGDDRFGYGASQVDVRLPVIVQPSLPRFLRPGDQFDAAATGRLLEGDDGDVVVAIRAPGLDFSGETQQRARLEVGQGTRVRFPATVPRTGTPDQITVSVATERRSDQVGDAFEVVLPIRPDRVPEAVRVVQQLAPGASLALPRAPASARDAERFVLATRRPELLAAAQATAALQQPGGNTAQRLSAARAWVGMGRLREALGLPLPGADDAAADAVRWMKQVIDDDGLIAWWPGADGSVTLTAWALHLDVELREAGHRTDPALTGRMIAALEQSLRSDDPHLVEGAAWLERVRALSALSAAGRLDEGYLAEAARAAPNLGAEGVAQVLLAAAQAGQVNTETTRELVEVLVSRARFTLRSGAEVFEGLESMLSARPTQVLSSEARGLAEMIRALSRQQPDHPRLPALTDALLARATATGWGDPTADAAALLAITEATLRPAARSTATLSIVSGEQAVPLTLSRDVVHTTVSGGGAAAVRLDTAEAPVTVAATLRYLPGTSGAEVDPIAEGFVLRRDAAIFSADGTERSREELRTGGTVLSLSVGEVVEEHLQLVSPAKRDHVALVIPLAAGMEALNPRLATAPPEATPRGQTTARPDYIDWQDDHVAFYFTTLPKGTWDVYIRTRASVPGRFTQPPARAALEFSPEVRGRSAGASVMIK